MTARMSRSKDSADNSLKVDIDSDNIDLQHTMELERIT